jgi:hypothetical protein
MRKFGIGLLILFVACVVGVLLLVSAFQPPDPPRPLSSDFVLEGVTVVNPGSDLILEARVVVSNGVISEIGDGVSAGESDIATRFTGAYILPGLVDMHTHLPPANILELTPYFSLLYLAHGVTSVRDAGDVDGTGAPAAREGIDSGAFPGPRIFSAGPFVTTGEARWPNSVLLNSPADAKIAVTQIRDQGHTVIKSYENLSVDMLRALESAADELGLEVMGHVPDELAYEEALIRDVQHFLGVPRPEKLAAHGMLDRIVDWSSVDDARMEEIVEVTLQHELANTPTLVSLQRVGTYQSFSEVYDDPTLALLPDFYLSVVWHPERGIPVYRNLDDSFFEKQADALLKKIRLVKKLHDAGARLHLGTDTQQPFVVPGVSVHEEMALFADAGVPMESVWKYATADAGQALKIAGLGTIAEGAPADMLIFRENPIEDLSALDTLEAVVVDGQLYLKEDLDKKVAEFRNHYASFPVKQLAAFFAQRAVNKAAQNFQN